jgi:carbamoyl-phosphate synthase small subunit
VWAAALVVRDLSPVVSNWRATRDLDGWLREHDVPGITGVETRALVRHIRDHGAMRAALATADPDPARLVALARAARDMSGLDLAREVTCREPYAWNDTGARHVVAYDFGIKRSILRMLAERGCRLTVVPAQTTAHEVLALAPDGVFLSNGPGDPAAVTAAIAAVRELLGKVPIFGICLGHQILALARE